MSEIATVTAIRGRVRRTESSRVIIDSSALEVAKLHIREQKEVALLAEEWEIAARWHDEEKSVLAALGGRGLARSVETS